MSDTKPTVISAIDPTYHPEELMTPAALWTFLAASDYTTEEVVEEQIAEDERNWLVPLAILKATMSFSEVVQRRDELPVITGGAFLSAFAMSNNEREGTLKVPDLVPGVRVGLRLPVLEKPDVPDDQLPLEKKMVSDIPTVVLIKPSGEMQNTFIHGGREVSLTRAFRTFQKNIGLGIEPDPYAMLLEDEGQRGTIEGNDSPSFLGKER